MFCHGILLLLLLLLLLVVVVLVFSLPVSSLLFIQDKVFEDENVSVRKTCVFYLGQMCEHLQFPKLAF